MKVCMWVHVCVYGVVIWMLLMCSFSFLSTCSNTLLSQGVHMLGRLGFVTKEFKEKNVLILDFCVICGVR